MINVTRTWLPPLEEYVALLRGVWQRAHLTNHGPLLVELERQLRLELDVPYCTVVCNGTLALQIAFHALKLKGAVLTTPFSYVATTAAVAWEGLTPVFADIEPDTLCLSVACARAAWRDDIGAILATHVYGNACDVEALAALGRERRVPVIYDAAHAFGARLEGRALAAHGDIATLSFHATKLFHTGEGGALITHDPQLAARIEYLRNFGHSGPNTFIDYGTNAKVSELHAAMGLCVLPRVPELIARRQALCAVYDAELRHPAVTRPTWRAGLERNHSYYPVLFASEAQLLEVQRQLTADNIHPRRYFHPALNRLVYVEPVAMPVAESVSSRVLCLPLAAELDPVDVRRICAITRRALG